MFASDEYPVAPRGIYYFLIFLLVVIFALFILLLYFNSYRHIVKFYWGDELLFEEYAWEEQEIELKNINAIFLYTKDLYFPYIIFSYTSKDRIAIHFSNSKKVYFKLHEVLKNKNLIVEEKFLEEKE